MKEFRSNSSQLVKIFDMQNLLVDAKEMVIRKLEKSKDLWTFLSVQKMDIRSHNQRVLLP